MVVVEKRLNFWGLAVSLIEDDLLAALRELREASLAMTSGKLPTSYELERYHQAIAWSERVIELAEKTK